MIKSAALILFLFLLQATWGQVKGLKLADQFYEKHLFIQAEKRFAKIHANGELDEINQLKWGNALFQMGDYDKAEEVLSEVISHPGASPEDIMRYVHCLKRKELYTKADRWMKVYAKLRRTDVRTKSYTNNPNYLYNLLKQDKYFEIFEVKASSRGADFGGVTYPGSFDVFLLSSRRHPTVKTHSWHLSQNAAYKLFKAKQGPKYQLVSPRIFNKKFQKGFEFGPLCFSKDGTWVFYTKRKKISWRSQLALSNKIPRWKIYVARVLPGGAWAGERELGICSDDYSVGHPALSPNEDFLIYVSDQESGVGETDLYQMPIELSETGIIEGESKNLGRLLNTEGNEQFPWFDEYGNLYFSSDGHQGFGGFDVFIAFQSSFGFQSVMNLGKPINSAFNDYGFVWSGDGYSGQFASDRSGKRTGDDLYSFELIKSLDRHFFFEGAVTDLDRGFEIPNAVAVLYDEFDLEIGRDTTEKDGMFQFSVETQRPYTAKVRAKGYHDTTIVFPPLDQVPPMGRCEEQVPLKINPELHLAFEITEKQDGEPLGEVLVHIIDLRLGQEVYLMRSNEEGIIRKKLPRSFLDTCLDFQVVLEKAGYLAQTFNFYHCIDSYGDIYVNDYDPMKMIRIENGVELQELMDWPKIDVNKIDREPTEETKKVLLKIVDLANANPGMKLEIGVYESCENGTIQAERMSERKAKYLADWVKGRAYSPGQIRSKGYGFTDPKVKCTCSPSAIVPCSEAMNEENRRVVVKIIM